MYHRVSMSVRLATHMRLILWPSLPASYSIHSMLGVLGLRPSNLSPKPSMEVFQPSYQAYGPWIIMDPFHHPTVHSPTTTLLKPKCLHQKHLRSFWKITRRRSCQC